MIKILIVDDEQNIVQVLKEYAEFNGMEVDVAFDGVKAYEKVIDNNYDCILLDIMMPNMDGYETAKKIKELKTIPIIMISAKSEEYDKLKGFELGIDDYIVKPFSVKEVMARIKAIMKRTVGFHNSIQYESMTIDFDEHTVSIDNNLIKLTKKEYELLITLIKNQNKALTREKLLNEVWGFDFYGDNRTIDSHIKMLRFDLGKYGKMIKTIRGVGYKFENSSKEK